MATLAQPPTDSEFRDPNVPQPSSEGVSLDHDVNGLATQQNNVPQFSSSSLTNGDASHTLQQSHISESSTMVDSGESRDIHSAKDQVDQSPADLVATVEPAKDAPGDQSLSLTPPEPSDSRAQDNGAANIEVERRAPLDASSLDAPPLPLDATAGDQTLSIATPQDRNAQEPDLNSHPTQEISFTSETSAPDTAASSLPALPPSTSDVAMHNLSTTDTAQTSQHLPTTDQVMNETTVTLPVKLSRERAESQELDAPSSKRAKIASEDVEPAQTSDPFAIEVMQDGQAQTPSAAQVPSTQADPMNTVEGSVLAAPPDASAALPVQSTVPEPDLEPITDKDYGIPMSDLQHRRLVEMLRNLKKAKYAEWFRKPVDWKLHNLLSYPKIVTQPMDLGTMESKLKNNQYNSVNDYVSDIDLIVKNAIRFNGPSHNVAQLATSLRATTKKQLEKVPGPGEAAPVVVPEIKRADSNPAPPREKRQATRPSLESQTSQRYALNNGVPQIRRDSTNNGGRPKREIKRTAPKDLDYPLPKKREQKVEFEFCEHVLNEMRNPDHDTYAWPFKTPVDSVALGIPDYHQKISSPRDVSYIQEHLQKGLYPTAEAFRDDWELMFRNCFTYNSATNHPVHMMGKKYQQVFREVWSTKKTWIREHTEPSEPDTASADSEEEEPSEDEENESDKRVAALQAQLRALQAQVEGVVGGSKKKVATGKPTLPKKATGKQSAKDGNTKSKKAPGNTTANKSKKETKSKAKSKPITQKQREEISLRIGQLSQEEIATSSGIIKDSFRRAGRHDLAARAEEEMEFDMDQIPEDALHQLFGQIRRVLGPPEKSEPGFAGFTPPKARTQTKKKKRAGGETLADREAQMHAIKGKIAQFDDGNGATSTGGPQFSTSLPTGDPESSDDDDDSGSESEEE